MIVIPFDRPGLKEPAWENVVVGEEFGPLDVVISDHAVKSHVYALDAYHPWYLYDSPVGGPIAPSTLLTRALLDLFVSQLRCEATDLLWGLVEIGRRRIAVRVKEAA